MGWIIGLLVQRGLSEKAARARAYAGLFLIIAAMIGGVYACVRNDAVSDHEAKIEQRAKPATDKAAAERGRDAIDNSKNQQERRDVIEAEPDQAIAPTSRALSCQRLRRRGNPPADCRP